ncbi:hypothetical protein, partial [Klebsiella aerogenes]|uniref:hypothetical protein n=1 Tax=Klebsiella aerogenes TaxID=548 RepID=UPI0000E1B4D6
GNQNERFVFGFGTARSRFIVTGKVYEGVTGSLTVQEHNIDGRGERGLGHKPKVVEDTSRN